MFCRTVLINLIHMLKRFLATIYLFSCLLFDMHNLSNLLFDMHNLSKQHYYNGLLNSFIIPMCEIPKMCRILIIPIIPVSLVYFQHIVSSVKLFHTCIRLSTDHLWLAQARSEGKVFSIRKLNWSAPIHFHIQLFVYNRELCIYNEPRHTN